jgi:hypothetical protein
MDSKRKRKTKLLFPLNLISSTPSETNLYLEQVEEGSPVWTVPNFLAAAECQEWIKFSEESGGLEYTAHPASMYTAHRKCFRMQDESNSQLAKKIYRRLIASGIVEQLERALTPSTKGKKIKNKYEHPVGCNPNLRLYKYVKGHSFGRHIDESNAVDGMGQTEITVLIYLSQCQGGATRFYTPDISSKKKKKSFAFDPEQGTMLLHIHGDDCLEHEAEPVLDGIKYVLRTDVVFS